MDADCHLLRSVDGDRIRCDVDVLSAAADILCGSV
jgi:hypothetical protein